MTYRERMATMTTLPWCLLSGDFSDELDAKIKALTARVAGTEETIKVLDGKISALDAKITACCDDAFKATLRQEVASLRTELNRLRPTP